LNPISIDQIKGVVHTLHQKGRLSNVSLYVSGPPGIGKSATFKQLADELDADHEVYLACTMDPTDVTGVPFPMREEGITRFLPPERLVKLTTHVPRKRFTIAVFDDLPACHEQVFAALFRFFYERYVGEHPIRDNVLLCGTGNRAADNAGAREMPTALANRFVHYEMKADTDQWMSWAYTHDIHPLIISFIQTSGPRMLHDFEPSRGDVCFPSPRSVANASLMYQALERSGDQRVIVNSLAGCCGEGWAHAFLTYAQLREKLVPVEQILADPDNAPVPQEIDILYAVVANLLCTVGRDVSSRNVNQSIKYANRIPHRDTAAKMVKDIVKMVHGKTEIYEQIKDVLTEANRRYGTLLSLRGGS